ncbi:MAG: hypothetical protein RBU29_05615 [bacterium]|jgi:hypothetical protein|nr:hypothetical protein [bacterium]
MSKQKKNKSTEMNHEQAHGTEIQRRSILGGSLAAIAGMLLGSSSSKEAQAQARPLLELGGICDGHLIALKQKDAIQYLQNQMKQSTNFAVLFDHFTKNGMEFILERAQVFMYMAETDGPGSALTPNVIGIAPSFVKVEPTADFHDAVGIVVHQNGKALAGGVRVNHNPFSIVEFSVFEVVGDADPATGAVPEVVVNRISADELAADDEATAARKLTYPNEDPATWDPNVATLRHGDRESVAAMVFHSIISDERSRPMYTPEGLESLLAQTPLVQKFANVNYIRYAQATAKQAGWCCSTSSSCNASTSTSTSTSISIEASKT